MTDFLILFICLSTVNVVFSTIRSIITIKGGKLLASLFSAGYFSFYNIMMIYTVMDFSMWHKCIITFVCNFVGVYLVKWGEEHTPCLAGVRTEMTCIRKPGTQHIVAAQ